MTRLKTRTSRLRQIEELLLLTPGGLHVNDLSRRLRVDRRTVYRDLDFLCDQGVPLWQDAGRFGVNRSRYFYPIRLSFHESLALVLAGLLLSRTIDERSPHVTSALRKLAATLPFPLATQLERAAGRVQTHTDSFRHVAVLEAVAEAWAAGRKVQVEYRSPRSGALRPRVIAPYAMEPTAFGVYIIAFDDWSNAIRTFKLERLESAQILEETYTIPADFDPEAHLAASWGIMSGSEVVEVVLRFSSTAAPHLHERRWHPSQSLEPTPDGGCFFRVRVSAPLEMQPWIRSWGAQVEVLSPDWLRDRISAELRQAADRYSAPARVDDSGAPAAGAPPENGHGGKAG